jgi:hypothetical protein
MRLLCIGILGMFVGRLPRFGSILIGETTRGSQGFDVNFDPIQIILHLWYLVSFPIPELLEIRTPIVQLLKAEWYLMSVVRAVLAGSIFILMVKSVIHFIVPRLADIKAISQFEKLKFELGVVLIVCLFSYASTLFFLRIELKLGI